MGDAQRSLLFLRFRWAAMGLRAGCGCYWCREGASVPPTTLTNLLTPNDTEATQRQPPPASPTHLPREAGRQLELLGCDTDAADAAASEFLPNGGKLNLVCADAAGSISIMAYDAQVR